MIVGSVWNPEATFYDSFDVLYDPDTVTFNTVSPTGVEGAATFINPSTGIYLASVLLDEPGYWWVQVVGEGPDGAVVVGIASMCATSSLVPV